VAGAREIKNVLGALAAVASCAVVPLRAAQPGDEVVVIYNTRLPESKGVADYYAQRRQCRRVRSLAFPFRPMRTCPEPSFVTRWRSPWSRHLKAGNSGVSVPTRSRDHQPSRPHGKEGCPVQDSLRGPLLRCSLADFGGSPAQREGEQQLRAELRRNEAAVDSDLALLPLIDPKPMLAGPLRNQVYTTTNIAMLNPTNGVLMVARLDGPSAAIARGLVDKALEAETNGLWGRAYFDLRNTKEPGLKQGDDWIRGAADICRHLGL
jgi:uncharacterized protein (TIGR03790 family)